MKSISLIVAMLCLSNVSAAPISARYIRVEIPKASATLTLAEVQVFSKGVNVALKGKAKQTTTRRDAVASRAIDGNTSANWESNTMTHTIEDQPHPAWELDLGAEYPVDKVVLWNRDGFAQRLNDVRVTLADKTQTIRFTQDTPRPSPRDTTITIDATQAGHSVGKRLPSFKVAAQKANLSTALEGVNVTALFEALTIYSEKYPEDYPNKDELLASLASFMQRISDAAQANQDLAPFIAEYRKLQKAVLLQHPAVDFDELLFVKRYKGSPQGLFANWQGNSGPNGVINNRLLGYNNELIRAPLCQDDGEAKVLKKSTAFLGDLCLDWDAERILLSSGQETPKTAWRLFEINSDGTDFREAYPNPDLSLDVFDACYLPDGRIMTTVSAGFQGVPCVNGSDYVSNMYLFDKDRKSMRRLTYDQDSNWNPEVYPNGRVIFLRWEYTDSSHYFSRILMTMNPDGTDQKEFYGSNSYWPNSLFYHQNIPGSSTKFVGIVSGHHGVARKGQLIMFDVSKGRHETSGTVHEFPYRGRKVKNITKDYLVNGLSTYFLHPRPLNDELVIASMQEKNGNFRIVLVDVYDNVLTLWESPDANLYEPIPLKALKRPPQQPDRVDLTKTTATTYITDIYIGQKTLEGIPTNAVKKLRIFNYEYALRNIGGHYAIGMEGPWDPRILHGTVDVETDGSCMFEIPANTPFATQPLDKDGRALQHMRSWMVAMPGEKLSCIGCHESQNLAAPAKITIAAQKPSQEIRPWYGAKRGFSFDREVQPLLDAKCIGCHDGNPESKNAIGQVLPNFKYRRGYNGFSGAYDDLHPYIRRNGPEGDYHVLTPMEFYATTSDLVQLIEKGHYGVTFTAEDWDRINTWIDLNVPYFGTWTERGADKRMIAKRREYDRITSNLTFDPEVIYNPYKPDTIAFVPPTQAPERTATPTLTGWPFDGVAKQGAKQYINLPIGDAPVLKAVKIPAGSFVMGSNDETDAEYPQSIVAIDKPFYMATTEITMAQWRQFDPTYADPVYDMHYKDQVRRGYFMRDPQFPVIRISWDMAQAYCKWLSEKTGKKVRLPTEAEWEYACRAGTATPMNYGDFNADFSKHANLADVSIKLLAVSGVDPQPIRNPNAYMDFEKKDPRYNDGALHLAKVGKYKPNAFGLYDMHGNIAEWTSSAWAPYPYNKDAKGERKVLRGGSWYQRQIRASSAWRYGYAPWHKVYNAGIRLVIED